jgi:hypothetical protein
MAEGSSSNLVVTQKLMWETREDSATGISASFDDSQPADAQVHVAKAVIKVGDSFSGQAMTRELWFSEAEGRAIHALLAQMFADLDAHRGGSAQS